MNDRHRSYPIDNDTGPSSACPPKGPSALGRLGVALFTDSPAPTGPTISPATLSSEGGGPKTYS